MKKVSARVASHVGLLVAFAGVAVLLRGEYLTLTSSGSNPDSAELLVQARAALHSPVPFTTWSTTTTGPFWVWFLMAFGAVGLPLTSAFGYLLAAVLIGLLGYLGFLLAWRGLSFAFAMIITLFWWLPMVLVIVGDGTNFATLSTELLPCVLILSAALIPAGALNRYPILFLVVGLICGLAVGSKYQIAPLALAVLAVQLMQAGELKWRTVLRDAALWGAGAALPMVAVGIVMLVSSDIDTAALQINLNFLTGYSGKVSLGERMASWLTLVSTMHLLFLMLGVLWLGWLSPRWAQFGRAAYVLAGLLAVFLGGRAWSHYLIIVYAGIVLAIGLPLKPQAALVPFTQRRSVGVIALTTAALVGWIVSFGLSPQTLNRANRAELQFALSADNAPRDPRLASACPAGSKVIVWGFVPDLYLNYSWQNAIPFINIVQLTGTPTNYTLGYELINRAVEDTSTTCVIDAVGSPFLSKDQTPSLFDAYPAIRTVLATGYQQVPELVDCETCTVYVRR